MDHYDDSTPPESLAETENKKQENLDSMLGLDLKNDDSMKVNLEMQDSSYIGTLFLGAPKG